MQGLTIQSYNLIRKTIQHAYSLFEQNHGGEKIYYNYKTVVYYIDPNCSNYNTSKRKSIFEKRHREALDPL